MTSLERSVRGQHPGTCLLQVGCDEVVTTNRAALGVTRWLVSPSVRVGYIERGRRGALTRDVHLRCRVALPAARAFAERGWPCSDRPRATRVTDWCATRPSRATSFRSGSGARPGRCGAGRGGGGGAAHVRVAVRRKDSTRAGRRRSNRATLGSRPSQDLGGGWVAKTKGVHAYRPPAWGDTRVPSSVGHLRGWRGGRGALRGR